MNKTKLKELTMLRKAFIASRILSLMLTGMISVTGQGEAQEMNRNVNLIFNSENSSREDADGLPILVRDKFKLEIINIRQRPMSCTISAIATLGRICPETVPCDQFNYGLTAMNVDVPVGESKFVYFSAPEGTEFTNSTFANVVTECDPVTFVDWCEESKSAQPSLRINAAAKSTIASLFKYLQTQECEVVNNQSRLTLKNMKIEDPRPIFGIASLKTLVLKNNKGLDLRGISRATGLRTLTVSDNNLTTESIAELGSMPELESIDLSFNRITNASVLEKSSKLEFLDLSFNNLEALPDPSRWRSLDELLINANPGITTIDALKPLFSVGQLNWVDATCTGVTQINDWPSQMRTKVSFGTSNCF